MNRSKPASPSARLNDATGWFVIALLAAVPIPFGSNRPVFWTLWALVAALAVVAYVLASVRMRTELLLPFGAFPFEIALFGALAVAIAAQLAPLGGILDLSLPLADGSRLPLAVASVAPGDTWLALLRWLTYGLVFFLILQISVQRKRARLIAGALVLIVSIEALYALMALVVFGDTILVFEKTAYAGMATGSFVNRNSLATFLGIGAVLSVSELLDASFRPEDAGARRERRILLLLALGFIFAALLVTQSRMGLLATGLGFLVVVLLLQPRMLVRPVVVLPILAAFALPAMLYGDGVLDRMITLERAVSERGELYRQIIGMIAERPWLGYGAGSFRTAYPLFHDPPVDPAVTWDHAHSTYLALWSGLGIVAGSLPLVLIASFCRSILRGIATGRAAGSAASAALGATVLVAIHALVDFSLEIQAVAMLYIAVLAQGAASALHRRPAA